MKKLIMAVITAICLQQSVQAMQLSPSGCSAIAEATYELAKKEVSEAERLKELQESGLAPDLITLFDRIIRFVYKNPASAGIHAAIVYQQCLDNSGDTDKIHANRQFDPKGPQSKQKETSI